MTQPSKPASCNMAPDIAEFHNQCYATLTGGIHVQSTIDRNIPTRRVAPICQMRMSCPRIYDIMLKSPRTLWLCGA